MNSAQQERATNPHKDKMYIVIAELFEKTGANDLAYTDTQKATDILEVLATLLAFTIYNSCPNSETVRDTCEAAYFQIKQMALAYHYQVQKDTELKKKSEHMSSQSAVNRSQFNPRKF